MFKKLLILLMMLSCCMSCLAAPAGMKLYRNSEWQFSLYIPDDFYEKTPRGPNVKMSCVDSGGNNINVIVKSVPGAHNVDEETLTYILEEQKRNYSSFSGGGKLAFAHLIDMPPNHRGIEVGGTAYWKTPDGVTLSCAVLVTTYQNQKEYTLCYYMRPDVFDRNAYKIKQSIASFQDETGW